VRCSIREIKNTSMSIIKKAETIREKRSTKYGSPKNNMAIYCELVNAFLKNKLKEPIDSREAAIVGGILMKLSREAHEHNEDNLLDVIGWADVANEVQ
jgi:hypothetical protein